MKRFRIQNSNWKYDAIDWIGEAIRIIGFGCGTEIKTIPVRVINYKAEIPLNIEILEWIDYNGIRLPLGYDNTEYGLVSNSENRVTMTYLEILEINKLIELLAEQEEIYASNPIPAVLALIEDTKERITKAVKNATVLNKTSSYKGDWYNLEGSYIKTSFETGTINLKGTFIPVCERGMPLVLDNELYLQALEWFCIYNLILQGYSHPTIKDWREALAMFTDLYPKAQNNIKAPNIDQLDRFVSTWNSIKRDFTQSTLISDI